MFTPNPLQSEKLLKGNMKILKVLSLYQPNPCNFLLASEINPPYISSHKNVATLNFECHKNVL
jgi:hypothetical protein